MEVKKEELTTEEQRNKSLTNEYKTHCAEVTFQEPKDLQAAFEAMGKQTKHLLDDYKNVYLAMNEYPASKLKSLYPKILGKNQSIKSYASAQRYQETLAEYNKKCGKRMQDVTNAFKLYLANQGGFPQIPQETKNCYRFQQLIPGTDKELEIWHDYQKEYETLQVRETKAREDFGAKLAREIETLEKDRNNLGAAVQNLDRILIKTEKSFASEFKTHQDQLNRCVAYKEFLDQLGVKIN
jgi:hypothetical protein